MERQYKLLIVDDESGIRDEYSGFFEDRGFIVETAKDGQDGLESLRKGEFDVAIVDIKMPRLDGLKMIKQAKAEGIETSMIIITGHGERHDAIQAIKAGVEDWFDKSEVVLDTLKERVIQAAQILSLDEIQQILSGIPD